jgi:hypothetical protein
MKFLHQSPETKNNLLNEVSNWYQSQIDLRNKKTEIISKSIGHISSKHVSVKIEIKDEANNLISVYFTPKNWWVKKLHKNQSTGFSKAVLQTIESHVQ